jgi:hypothetical protein
VDVIVTNPPFAGDVHYPGYAVARAGRRAERDALFVERCVELLRPGGRLAIVLPHNKAAASAWSGLRRWLVEQARVLAVVSLPRETFLPHTSQKAVVVFAKRRARAVPFTRVDRAERTFFARSDRAGKDAAGEPIARSGAGAEPTWRTLDHDLDTITAPLAAFLHAEGFASGADHGAEHGRAVASTSVVRALGELGDALTLAPERYCAPASVDVDGELLSSLVVERKERVVGDALATAVVFDTTHAKDGVLDARAALRGEPPSSAKKRVQPGDLLVSRLRPYLRQIALVHPAVRVECEGRAMACSTEFYVLSPRTRGESLAFLVGWLLGEDTQAHLAAAQEGGHHPRVPREVLLAMRVPRGRVLAREQASAKVERALAKAYSAGRELDEALR